jgi:hypothetical protein
MVCICPPSCSASDISDRENARFIVPTALHWTSVSCAAAAVLYPSFSPLVFLRLTRQGPALHDQVTVSDTYHK